MLLYYLRILKLNINQLFSFYHQKFYNKIMKRRERYGLGGIVALSPSMEKD